MDVEVYCVNFDKQYLVDEEVLAHAEGIAEGPPGAKLLLPPAPRARDSGRTSSRLTSDAARRREAAKAKAEAEAEAAAAYQALVAEALEKGEEPPPRPEPAPEAEERRRRGWRARGASPSVAARI